MFFKLSKKLVTGFGWLKTKAKEKKVKNYIPQFKMAAEKNSGFSHINSIFTYVCKSCNEIFATENNLHLNMGKSYK